MSNLTDRVSYLKGLAEGMKLTAAETNEARLLNAIIEVLGDMAADIAELHEKHDELEEYVESIDDDLSELEDAMDDCDCCHCDEDDDDEDDEDDEDDDDELVSYDCPNCGHSVEFRAAELDLDEDYICPACGKPIFPESEDDDDPEDQ